MGKKFTDHLYLRNVLSLLIPTKNYTTQVISLVTPDGERTMRCLPGAGNDLTASDLHPNIFRTTKHVHFEDYALYNYELVESAMRMAKENGATISFDLASFEVVRRHKNFILHILKSYVDIVFVNQNVVSP